MLHFIMLSYFENQTVEADVIALADVVVDRCRHYLISSLNACFRFEEKRNLQSFCTLVYINTKHCNDSRIQRKNRDKLVDLE